MLPLAFTLARCIENQWFRLWTPGSDRMPQRLFYYTDAWAADRERLPGPEARPQVRWWDTEEQRQNEDTKPRIGIDPSRSRTPREQLDGFVETFVIGWSRHRLIRKQGFGSEPPFRRMWPPRGQVVEMRTVDTRSFGVFTKGGAYIGMRVDLVDNTHADNDRLYNEYGDYVIKRLRHIDPAEIDATTNVEDLIGD
jgi:hypothetical protein